MKTPEIVINQITDANRKALVKSWFVGPHGEPVKKQGGMLRAGTVASIRFTLAEYIGVAVKASYDQFFVTSTVEYPPETIVLSRDMKAEYGEILGGEYDGGIITRTKHELVYKEGVPGAFVCDHDFNERCTTMFSSPEEFVDLQETEFPMVFKDAAHGSYYSSSSFIYKGKEKITGAKGFHVVYAALDSADIPRFRDAYFGHLWLRGYGYIAISRAGTPLVRTIFDKIAVQAHQPIFTTVRCDDGLVQKRPDPVVSEGHYINTHALPSLTSEQQTQVEQLQEEAKRKAKPELDAARRAYIKTQKKTLAERGITGIRASRIIESRLEGVLVASDVLYFDDEGGVTVGETLKQPSSWDRKTLADPIEPDYGGGRGKAIYFANEDTGTPLIFSHAHGGRHFFLRHDLESILAAFESAEETKASDVWIDMALSAELRPDEEEEFLEAVKSKTGRTLSALRRTLKQERTVRSSQYVDASDFVADQLLRSRYRGGLHLMQTPDRSFWRYTGTHWELLMDPILEGELHRTAKSHWGRVLSISGKQKPTLSDLVNRAIKVIGRRVIREGDPLRLKAAPPSVINCINGELWLTDDGPVLRPHRAESFLMACSTIMYDPAATAPTYDQLLGPMFDDPEVIRHLNEMMGYLIQPTRFLKTFYILVGEGDNGKSQLFKLFSRIVGHESAYWDRLDGIEKDPFRIIHLLGKIAFIDDDAEKGFLLPDGFLKRISEEKPMTGRHLYKKFIDFIATIVVVILSNHFPASRDLSRGMRTRALVLKFPHQFLKPGEYDDDGNVVDDKHPYVQRPDLWRQVFESEMPGVLNIWVNAFYRLKERGAFDVPLACKKAAEEWQGEANPVARFFSELFEVGDGDGYLISTLYTLYEAWAEQERIQKRYIVGRHQFGRSLRSMGLKVKRSNRGFILVDRKLTDDAKSAIEDRMQYSPEMLERLGLERKTLSQRRATNMTNV